MIVEQIRSKYEQLQPLMNERLCRLWAATEASVLGRGGITRVAEATGMSRTTIASGMRELEQPVDDEFEIRRAGGGRKRLEDENPELPFALEMLVDPATRGDPESSLRWTSKSTRRLSDELGEQGYRVSPQKVGQLLREAGYSLQSNRKATEGTSHPDRDAQFQYLNRRVKDFQKRGEPVISVDTKKKELVGDFKNGGQEWRPAGDPERVRVHDFEDKQLGKAIPYGIYDLTANQGWVSVGTDHDTPEFAVESITRWWRKMGKRLYPDATELLITADAGGSNSYRARLWKVALQKFSDKTGLKVTVCHFPPGTSKWNKIEHRMFCQITQNWRGKPLTSLEVIVNLIANTTTETGLSIKADLDLNEYPKGIKVSDDELEAVNLKKKRFHGDWNYSILPKIH